MRGVARVGCGGADVRLHAGAFPALDYGRCDPAKKHTAGRTAADWARKRGMADIAAKVDRDLH